MGPVVDVLWLAQLLNYEAHMGQPPDGYIKSHGNVVLFETAWGPLDNGTWTLPRYATVA
jgi:hypothetical protein